MLLKTKDNGCLFSVDEDNKTSRAKLREKSSSSIVLTKKLLNECPFKEYIFFDYDVMFILVKGSSLTGLSDDYSDIDLVVLTKNPVDRAAKYSLSYNNKRIHWYYYTFERHFYELDFISSIGLVQDIHINDDALVYLNDKYVKYGEFFKENKNILAEIGYISSGHTARYLANCLLERNFVDIDALPLKYYHQIVELYYYITNISRDVDFLKRIKRMRYTKLSNIDINRLTDILKKFVDLEPPELQKVYFLRENLLALWKNL